MSVIAPARRVFRFGFVTVGNQLAGAVWARASAVAKASAFVELRRDKLAGQEHADLQIMRLCQHTAKPWSCSHLAVSGFGGGRTYGARRFLGLPSGSKSGPVFIQCKNRPEQNAHCPLCGRRLGWEVGCGPASCSVAAWLAPLHAEPVDPAKTLPDKELAVLNEILVQALKQSPDMLMKSVELAQAEAYRMESGVGALAQRLMAICVTPRTYVATTNSDTNRRPGVFLQFRISTAGFSLGRGQGVRRYRRAPAQNRAEAIRRGLPAARQFAAAAISGTDPPEEVAAKPVVQPGDGGA
jgi:hypothetical protein